MKLIIDIPDDVYEKALNGGYKCRPIFDAITNGIPLEQIRDEIKAEMDDIASGCVAKCYYSGLSWALRKIDKYMKGDNNVDSV